MTTRRPRSRTRSRRWATSIRSTTGTRSTRSPTSWAWSTAAWWCYSSGPGSGPEEAFGAEWRDIDLDAGVVTVRRAFAKGRLKDYPKTVRSRRRVPARGRVLEALRRLPHRRGILFPTAGGGRVDIDNFRHRGWTTALAAAGSRIVGSMTCVISYATWSLDAGVDIFTLARRMGTSLQMIDRTCGHLASGAETTSASCWTRSTTGVLGAMGAVWALRSRKRHRRDRETASFPAKRTTGVEPATFGLGSRRSTN